MSKNNIYFLSHCNFFGNNFKDKTKFLQKSIEKNNINYEF